MRKDLNKQLCEHERYRSWDKFSNYRHKKDFNQLVEDDELYSGQSSTHRERMKIRFGGWRKSFGENLNPLYGFVRKNVGRKWDDVYSELCQSFNMRNVINQHILVHLFQYVEKDTRIGEDGKVYYLPQYFGINNKGWLPIEESNSEYYVHPTTNVLMCNSGRLTPRQSYKIAQERRQAEELAKKRVINKTTELHKINGVWYEVKFEYVDGAQETKMVNEAWRKNWFTVRTVFPYRYDILVGGLVAQPRVAVSKRQLNHKELRNHGLI